MKQTENLTNFNKNITIELNDHDNHISLVIKDNGIGFKNLKNDIKEILNPYFDHNLLIGSIKEPPTKNE